MAAAAMLSLAVAQPYQKIAGYQPLSDVTQHAYLDLDQTEMEVHLNAGDWHKARNIYTMGGNSGAKATLTVSGLAGNVSKGTTVTQGAATGYFKTEAGQGQTTLEISYTSTCKQGGTVNPVTTGCFTNAGGSIILDDVTDAGSPSDVKNSYRTLQGFSTAAESKMAGQEFYAPFHAYYDHGDYADRQVMGALDGTMPVSGDTSARGQFVKKTTAYMNVWMYAIREMEDAIIDCSVGCMNCNDDPVHAWDEAVAFYTGSLEGQAQGGTNAGTFPYRLAIKRCANYGTCGSLGNGVNTEIFEQFELGKTKLNDGKCVEVISIKRRIVQLMSVPLVQGSLRYAYKVSQTTGGDKKKEKAEGSVFTAAILPLVAVCNADAAKTINDNMKYDAASTSWTDVKAAYELTYSCLGITCAQVGSLAECAAPSENCAACSDTPTPAPTPAPACPTIDGSDDATSPVLTIVITAVVTGIIVGGLVYVVNNQRQNQGDVGQELVTP